MSKSFLEISHKFSRLILPIKCRLKQNTISIKYWEFKDVFSPLNIKFCLHSGEQEKEGKKVTVRMLNLSVLRLCWVFCCNYRSSVPPSHNHEVFQKDICARKSWDKCTYIFIINWEVGPKNQYNFQANITRLKWKSVESHI